MGVRAGDHGRLPVGIIGKDVVEFYTRARFGHHWSNGVAPTLVMLCFFMSRGRLYCAIGFDQDESRRIILLLDDVEARDSRFFDTLAGVGERRLFEGFNVFRLETNLNVNDKHN